MLTAAYLFNHASSYPGDYEPLPERRKILAEILGNQKNSSTPPVHIIKQPGYYKIEMIAPGYNRQDLYIQSNKHHLTISGMIEYPVIQNVNVTEMKAFGCSSFQSEIDLPEDSDLNFVSAELKDGILNIHVYRSFEAEDVIPGEIIVY